jgi:hypothetical protein
LRVNLAPQFTIHLARHPLGEVGEFYANGHCEISLFAASISQTSQIQGAALTILLLGHIYSVHQTIPASLFYLALELLPPGTLILVDRLDIVKIL